MSRRFRSVVAVGAAWLVLIGASACSAGGTPRGEPGAGVRVVATTTQVADFTRIVVGDEGQVTQLIKPNRSAHGFDPSAADLTALSRADALVMNGLGLESWLGGAVAASGFSGTTIVATRDIPQSALRSLHAGDAHESGDSAEHTDVVADTGGDDHAHEPTGVDPHVWTNPDLAADMVRTIAQGLSEAAPAHAAQFERNASGYLAKLAALTDWMSASIGVVPPAQRLLVSNHDAFGYFVERFGLHYVGSIMPSFDDNAEPSAADIDALVAAIRVSGVKAVFSETSISPKTAETIAREAGVAVYAGADALYGDSLGAPGSEGAEYLGSQIHNVRVLLESWGATPAPLPPGLEGA